MQSAFKPDESWIPSAPSALPASEQQSTIGSSSGDESASSAGSYFSAFSSPKSYVHSWDTPVAETPHPFPHQHQEESGDERSAEEKQLGSPAVAASSAPEEGMGDYSSAFKPPAEQLNSWLAARPSSSGTEEAGSSSEPGSAKAASHTAAGEDSSGWASVLPSKMDPSFQKPGWVSGVW